MITDKYCKEILKQYPEYITKDQYGSNLQAAALSLMATGNVAINKVCMLIHGMTGERWTQVRDLSANYTGGHLWRLRDSWQDSDA